MRIPKDLRKELDFDRKVKSKCKIETKSGIKVQSKGEELIADFLFDNNINFDYDKKIEFDDKYWARPDFRIKGTKILIEFWGLRNTFFGTKYTPRYDDKVKEKIALYKQEGMKLIGVGPSDLPILDKMLALEFKNIGFKY